MTSQRSDADRAPVLDRTSFVCPQCGTFAHQSWVELGYMCEYDDGPEWERLATWRPKIVSSPVPNLQEAAEALAKGARDAWNAARCTSCEQWSVWHYDQMVFPLARLGEQPHSDMPDNVRVLYQEAAEVAAVSRRAGAALARATLERLIKHLDPDASKEANLASRITRIKDRGVSTPLGQMLDVVRVAGNGALHVEDQPDELVVMALNDHEGPQLLELFLEVANNLVDEMITKPKTAQGLWDKLPAGVKAQLESSTTGQSSDVADATAGSETTLG